MEAPCDLVNGSANLRYLMYSHWHGSPRLLAAKHTSRLAKNAFYGRRGGFLWTDSDVGDIEARQWTLVIVVFDEHTEVEALFGSRPMVEIGVTKRE